MKEIEVKAKIESVENIKEKLSALGCQFGVTMIQEDIIFLPVGIEYDGIVKGTPVVRVRNSNGVIVLTLKKRVIEGSELVKFEQEIIVDNKQKTIEIVEHMGFHEVISVNKKRIECKHDGVSICIDEVEGLGNFIEVEKMSDEEDGAKIQNQLTDFLGTLEIENENIITKGYDTLIYENMIKLI